MRSRPVLQITGHVLNCLGPEIVYIKLTQMGRVPVGH